jgi:hypothetical protein
MSRPTIRMAPARISSPMTDGISAYAGTISAYAATRRQEQNRSAQARWRMRRRLRLVTRQITLEPEWLDALEVRGYLDPFDRTLAKAEIAAVRKFMGEHSGQKQSNDRPPHHQTIATALIRRCSSWWSIASKGRKEGGIAAGPRAGRVPAPARGRKRLPVVGFAAEERVRPFKGQRGREVQRFDPAGLSKRVLLLCRAALGGSL